MGEEILPPFFILKRKVYKVCSQHDYMEEMLSIPKEKFEKMQRELIVLRDSLLYRRLLKFEENISKGQRYTRTDLGF